MTNNALCYILLVDFVYTVTILITLKNFNLLILKNSSISSFNSKFSFFNMCTSSLSLSISLSLMVTSVFVLNALLHLDEIFQYLTLTFSVLQSQQWHFNFAIILIDCSLSTKFSSFTLFSIPFDILSIVLSFLA